LKDSDETLPTIAENQDLHGRIAIAIVTVSKQTIAISIAFCLLLALRPTLSSYFLDIARCRIQRGSTRCDESSLSYPENHPDSTPNFHMSQQKHGQKDI
jgi:hypothetical protein